MNLDAVIWINGMPRSGTSWLSQIFDSHPDVNFKLSPLFSYEFKNYATVNSLKPRWEKLFKEVSVSEDEFINQTYRRLAGEYPVFMKSGINKLVIKDTRYHNLTLRLLELFPQIKFIHIIRHPCGAVNSWLRAPKEFDQSLNPLEEWRSGQSRKTSEEEFWGFEDWLKLTKLYLNLEKKYPNNVKVVNYEKLVNDPVNETKKMFAFVGLEMSSQTFDFIRKSQEAHHNGTYAVFKDKSVAQKWETQLDSSIVEDIQRTLIINELDYLFNE
ncbi:sulfotransferase [Aestuariibaculum sp. YM273]|uniref:sulfotransferase family protein n=1 Tax=Aestuariibaculum sp. YM273 TaxID=3070659 RepID=UPI0027DC55AE|nr:sulfotransferase [Aestuariibaculum sp. YM273]WMI65838.1 sulfotransferase [Aestuariibaculum sp. YM273]